MPVQRQCFYSTALGDPWQSQSKETDTKTPGPWDTSLVRQGEDS